MRHVATAHDAASALDRCRRAAEARLCHGAARRHVVGRAACCTVHGRADGCRGTAALRYADGRTVCDVAAVAHDCRRDHAAATALDDARAAVPRDETAAVHAHHAGNLYTQHTQHTHALVNSQLVCVLSTTDRCSVGAATADDEVRVGRAEAARDDTRLALAAHFDCCMHHDHSLLLLLLLLFDYHNPIHLEI